MPVVTEVLPAWQAMDMEDTNIARQMFRVFDMEPWRHQQVKWRLSAWTMKSRGTMGNCIIL